MLTAVLIVVAGTAFAKIIIIAASHILLGTSLMGLVVVVVMFLLIVAAASVISFAFLVFLLDAFVILIFGRLVVFVVRGVHGIMS